MPPRPGLRCYPSPAVQAPRLPSLHQFFCFRDVLESAPWLGLASAQGRSGSGVGLISRAVEGGTSSDLSVPGGEGGARGEEAATACHPWRGSVAAALDSVGQFLPGRAGSIVSEARRGEEASRVQEGLAHSCRSAAPLSIAAFPVCAGGWGWAGLPLTCFEPARSRGLGAWQQQQRQLSKKGKAKHQRGRANQAEEDEEWEEAEDGATGGSRGQQQRLRQKGKPSPKEGRKGGALPGDPQLLLAALRERAQANREGLGRELAKLRTGRATADLLDHVLVDAYGQRSPLSHVATVTVRDPQLLSVTLHDPQLSSSALSGLRASPMGLAPQAEGVASILVPVPKLTTESRQAMVKLASQACEAAKVSLRLIRKEALDAIKGEEMAEDEEKRLEKQVESLISAEAKELDSARATKERELLR